MMTVMPYGICDMILFHTLSGILAKPFCKRLCSCNYIVAFKYKEKDLYLGCTKTIKQ